MRRLRSLSFRAQLMLLVALSLLPALGLILYGAKERRDDALAEARTTANLEAAEATRGADLAVQTAQTMLAGLAASPSLPLLTSDTCSATLASTLATIDPKAGLGQLWLAATDGAVLCSANPVPPGLNVASLDAFVVARDTRRAYVGDFVNDPVSGVPAVVVARPVVDPGGRVISVLATSFDFSHIGSDLLNVGKDHLFLIVDRQGRVLVHAPARPDLLGKPVPSEPIRQAVLSQAATGSAEFTAYDGVDRLFSYRPFLVSDGPNPYIVLGKPTSEVYAASNADLRRNLIWLGVVSVLAFGAAWAIGDVLFLRRVKALLAGTRAVAAGTFTERIPVGDHDRDELALVARSFNEMTGQIAERARGLRESEALYRSLFESTSDGMTIADTDGRLVRVNPAFCAMHGYTQEEILASGILPLIAPEHRAQLGELVVAAQQGLPIELRSVDVRRDGSHFPVDVRGAPVPYLGQPHYLTLVRDITTMVENELALERLVAERTRELETLLGVSRTVGSTLEPGDVIQRTLEQLHEVVDYQAAGILTHEDGVLTILAGHREPGAYPADLAVGVQFPASSFGEIWERLSRGEAVVVHDARGDEPLAVNYRRSMGGDEAFLKMYGHIRAWMAVPMVVKDRVVGMLNVSRPEPGYFTERHARLALAFASQAGIALENARLFASSEQRRGESAALVDVARAVGSTLALSELVDVIMGTLRDTVGYGGASLLTREGEDLVILQARTPDHPAGAPWAEGIRFKVASAPEFAATLGRGEAVIIDDVKADTPDASRYRDVLQPFLSDPAFSYVHSWMAVPLLARENLVGMLSLSSAEPGFYRRDHANLVLGIATHAASAIENARLFAEAEARTREIATILDMSRSMSSTLDIDALLDTILGRVKDVVGYSAASIQVLEGGRPRVLRRDGPPLPSEANNGAVDIRGARSRILRHALRDGRVVVIDDVRGDSEEAAAYRSLIGDMLDSAFWYVVSWLAVPLRSKGTTFGYLALTMGTPGFYTPEKVRIASGLGDFIATAIENARLFAETESRRRQLATLLDVSHSVASTLELQPLLRLILDQLRAVIPYAGSAVFTFEPGGIRILESADRHGPEPEAAGLFLAEPPGNYALGELRAGHAIRSTNVRGDDDYARAFQQLLGPLIDEAPFAYIRSQVAVPLVAQDQVIGAMTVSRRDEDAFEQDDIELARAFASQAAVALQNAQAFAQREQRLRETEAMASISSQLTLNQPMKRTLAEIAAGVCAATGAGAASITLFDDEHAIRLTAWGSAGLPEGFTEAVTAVFAARGSSPAGYVRHTRKPIVVPGVREQLLEAAIPESVAEHLRRADWQSAIVFPLQYHETFLGTLNTFHAEMEPLTASRAPIFSAIADQVAAAVQNVRLFEESERRRGESETLARIAASLTFERSLQDVLDAMATEVVRSTGAMASAILLRGDAGMPRSMGGASGLPEGYLDAFYRLAGDGDVDDTAYWEETAVIPGARDLILRNPAFAEMRPMFEAAHWDTVVRVPFVYHQEARGTLVLYYRREDTPGAGEFPFLQAIASQAAVAVENARLYMHSERRREESEALARMAATLTFDKPLPEVLNLLATDVVRGTRAQAAAIILNKEDSISGAIGGSFGLPQGYLEAAYEMFAAPGAAPESYWTERAIAWNMRTRSLADPARTAIHPYLREADWESVARVPFVYRDRARGLLVLYYRAGEEPGDADFPYLEAIAAQASVAVENARLFAEVGDRSRQLEALYRADEQLHRSLRLEEVLHSLAEVAVAFFRSDRALILFWPDGPEGEAEVRQAAGVMSQDVAEYMSVSRRERARRGVYDPATVRVENRVAGSPGAEIARNAGILSFMEVPIRVDGRVAGLFTIGSSRPGDFLEEDQRTFIALTHRAELAIENARLFGQVGDRNRELETLYRADELLHRSLNVQEVLEALVDVAVTIFGAEKSLIITWPRGEDFVGGGIQVSRGLDADTVREMAADRQQLVMSEGYDPASVLVVNDTLGDARADQERSRRVNVRSFMELPLVINGEVFGIFGVASSKPNRFLKQDERTFLALTHRAELAIENARLFGEIGVRNRQLETLYRADQELHRSLRLDDVLGALLDVVGDMLGADHSALITWEPGVARPTIIGSRTVSDEALESLTASLARDGRERTFAGSLRIGRDDVIVIEDTALSDWPPERAIGLGIRSVIEIPVWVQGELFAILTAAYRQPRAFPVEERRIYLALAHRAALAIENARLYEQAQSLAAVEERQRLARELHDSVSQALYGIALGAKTARTLLDRDPSRVKEPVEYVLSLAEAGLAEMRALIFELRPESLEGEGLIAAIGKQVAATRARYQVAVEDDLCPEPAAGLPVKEAIYRICQEGLHNIVKHAHATNVHLRLECGDGRVTLELRDDGAGFDPTGDFPGHLGLRSMRERATRLGGELGIESAPGKGTTLRAWVPLV